MKGCQRMNSPTSISQQSRPNRRTGTGDERQVQERASKEINSQRWRWRRAIPMELEHNHVALQTTHCSSFRRPATSPTLGNSVEKSTARQGMGGQTAKILVARNVLIPAMIIVDTDVENQMNQLKKQQSGFTLVEIAIVLVIIGLLLGGVLKGQELINSAKVKNMMGDFRTVSTPGLCVPGSFQGLPRRPVIRTAE
jgi:prepilin-type N-terminal cleavage/methylation domain-containing protein